MTPPPQQVINKSHQNNMHIVVIMFGMLNCLYERRPVDFLVFVSVVKGGGSGF
jgi:hypothetical protein